MRGLGILLNILGYDFDCRICRGLVELPPVGRAVEAVDPQEGGLLVERAVWESHQELREIGLGSVVVPETVVAQTPVKMDSVITVRVRGKHREVLEQLRSLGILAVIEIVESRLILGIDVVSGKKNLILGLAGLDAMTMNRVVLNVLVVISVILH